MDRTALLAGMAAALAALAMGCGTSRVTDTPRTGTEQLLVSAAVDQAVSQLDFTFLEDRKVFIDDSLVDRVDRPFVVATVRARAREGGAILVYRPEDAHYVLELRCGSVGVDRNDFVLGIPAAQVPTPMGVTGTPEVSAYKSIRQSGVCQISFVVYRQDDGRFFYASGPTYGFSDHLSWWVLGAGPGTRGNIAPPRTPENTAQVRAEPLLPEEIAADPE